MRHLKFNIAGWSSLEARRAHNPKVAGSNPAPATYAKQSRLTLVSITRINAQIAQLVEQRTENPRVTGSIPVLGIFLCNKTDIYGEYNKIRACSSGGRALDF